MKVLGVGLHKTGTTTLGTCLKHFGLKHQAWSREGFGKWIDNRQEELLEIAEQYDSFEDFPWALMYAEFDRKFPGTRFILTRRKDGETWFRSVCKHSKWTGPHEVNLHVYGNELPYGLQAESIALCTKTIMREVRAYFKTCPESFLEVYWEKTCAGMRYPTSLNSIFPRYRFHIPTPVRDPLTECCSIQRNTLIKPEAKRTGFGNGYEIGKPAIPISSTAIC